MRESSCKQTRPRRPAVFIELDHELHEALHALAKKSDRSATKEALLAIRCHVQNSGSLAPREVK